VNQALNHSIIENHGSHVVMSKSMLDCASAYLLYASDKPTPLRWPGLVSEVIGFDAGCSVRRLMTAAMLRCFAQGRLSPPKSLQQVPL